MREDEVALQELPLPVVHLGSSREEKRSVALALLLVFTVLLRSMYEGKVSIQSRLYTLRPHPLAALSWPQRQLIGCSLWVADLGCW